MAEHQLILDAVQADFFRPAAEAHNARYPDEPRKQVRVVHRNDRDYFTYLTIEAGEGLLWDHVFELGWQARHLAQEAAEPAKSSAWLPFTDLVATRHLAHYLDWLNPAVAMRRVGNEPMLTRNVRVVDQTPGTGGDGPGPEWTWVALQVRRPDDLYYLGLYWARRSRQLEQERGSDHG